MATENELQKISTEDTKMTQNQAAKKMGFDTIYSYQRLEARRCNPSLKVISKIKNVFPDFSIDYTLNL